MPTYLHCSDVESTPWANGQLNMLNATNEVVGKFDMNGNSLGSEVHFEGLYPELVGFLDSYESVTEHGVDPNNVNSFGAFHGDNFTDSGN